MNSEETFRLHEMNFRGDRELMWPASRLKSWWNAGYPTVWILILRPAHANFERSLVLISNIPLEWNSMPARYQHSKRLRYAVCQGLALSATLKTHHIIRTKQRMV